MSYSPKCTTCTIDLARGALLDAYPLKGPRRVQKTRSPLTVARVEPYANLLKSGKDHFPDGLAAFDVSVGLF